MQHPLDAFELHRFYMHRKLYISINLLHNCCNDDKLLQAIALVLCIKRDHVNSIIYDYTLDKVMNVCHGNYKNIKGALSTAIKSNFVQETYYKDTHKNLSATKLTDEKDKKYVSFHVTINKSGHKVLYFKSTEKGIDSKKETQETTGPQSFKEVCDMLRSAIAMLCVGNFGKYADTYAAANGRPKGESMRRAIADPTQPEDITPLNTGISYQRISEFFKSGNMSRWKVMRLINNLRKKHLISSKHCQLLLHNYDPTLPEYDANPYKYFRDLADGVLNWIDKRTGETVIATLHSYLGKGKQTYMLFRPTGNMYSITGSIIIYNRRTFKVFNNENEA